MGLSEIPWKLVIFFLAVLTTIVLVFDSLKNWSELSSTNWHSVPEESYYRLPRLDLINSNHEAVGSPKNITGVERFLPDSPLPAGGKLTLHGEGTWHLIPGTTSPVGKHLARLFTYAIEVEDGLDSVEYGGDDAFAQMVDATLSNPKSWIHNPNIGFQRVDPRIVKPDFYISLTSAMTLRGPCEYSIKLETSCYAPREGKVLINESRWVRGALSFAGDLGTYRQYAINHEVGHAIGFIKHEPCRKSGGLAPIMMQQTLGLANNDISKIDPDDIKSDGLVCVPNAWPFPQI